MLNILLGNWAKIEIKLADTVDTVRTQDGQELQYCCSL